MEKFKRYTEQLYNNCSELIAHTDNNRDKFINIYESSNMVLFECCGGYSVKLTTTEMTLQHNKLSLYFKDNIIQFSESTETYITDVIHIPNYLGYSFYRICTEDDLFQLSTMTDIKFLKVSDILQLNRLKEYFEYRYLKNNT